MNTIMETTQSPATTMEGVRRPARPLLYYYLMQAVLTGPGFPFLALYGFFRYKTLRYEFDRDGLTVRWGILFRREITLTYTRIQDIHLTSNLIERWLKLGRVQIQTASGSATAEVTIEGLADFERVRDELYIRMRGARGDEKRTLPTRAVHAQLNAGDVSMTDVVTALGIAASELRALREELARERER